MPGPNNKNKYVVLVIDSPGPEVNQLVKNLAETNLEVVHIEDGQKACEFCEANRPHVIITELDLPVISGVQLFRFLKNNFITSQIPIIVTTKEPKLEDRIKSMEMGIDDYIEKPYFPEEVVVRVHSLLNETRNTEKSRWIINHGFKGDLEEMNVLDLIKTMELSRTSGIIYLTRGYMEGQIFVNNGSIIDAFIDGFEPEQALTHMLTWLKGTFWVSIQQIERTRMINENNSKILSKGTRLIQQWKDLARLLPPLNTSLKAITPAKDEQISHPEKQMLDRYYEPKTIMQGIEESKMDNLHALELVRSLLQKGLLIKGAAPHQVKDPFAQIVFDHAQKKESGESTYNQITSYFKRDQDPGGLPQPVAERNNQAGDPHNNPSPHVQKIPYRVFLSKQELKRVREFFSKK
ncbi:MAG TPA: response regulator [bacterium]|nr:response regulator [bacterium]HPN44300.1 response regulator [bacterium]